MALASSKNVLSFAAGDCMEASPLKQINERLDYGTIEQN